MSYPEIMTLEEPQQRYLDKEKRKSHDPNLEILLHPDISGEIDSILARVQTGNLELASARSQLLQMFTETAARDRKTGLYLKEAIEIKLDPLMIYCREMGVPLSIIYFDGKNFKRINEEIGHHTGDEVIRVMAQALQQATRDDDLLARLKEEPEQKSGNNTTENHARIGGDEFLMVLPEVDSAQAQRILDRFTQLLASLAEQRVPEHRIKFGVPVTASAGIVQYDPTLDDTPKDFIGRAEMKMKQNRLEAGE